MIIPVVQRAISRHDDQDLLLEQMPMPSRRPAPRAHSLDGKPD
jgi:hypothetical protein